VGIASNTDLTIYTTAQAIFSDLERFMIVAFQTLEQGHIFILETNSPKNFLMKNVKWIGSTVFGEESLQQVFDRPNGDQGQRWIPM